MQQDIRINLMVSNTAAILSLTFFMLNVSTCLWYVFSCDNLAKGGACQDETWAGIVHSHEGKKYCYQIAHIVSLCISLKQLNLR